MKFKSGQFQSGQIVMTRGVNDLVADNGKFAAHVYQSLKRHLAGDWGDVCAEDKMANESALRRGDRIMSVYKNDRLPVVWVITEWNRSATTILLPEEY